MKIKHIISKLTFRKIPVLMGYGLAFGSVYVSVSNPYYKYELVTSNWLLHDLICPLFYRATEDGDLRGGTLTS